jgi:AcrR family transcriptional regulator
MARRRDQGRLAAIAESATTVFQRLGFRRTHVADVAAHARVSSGAIYSYVESKDALFHLVVAKGFDQFEADQSLPLRAPPLQTTMDVINRGLRSKGSTPILRAALKSQPPANATAELAAIVDEQYSMIGALWPMLSLIEACATDIPALEELYYGRRRRRYHDQLTEYLRLRTAQGCLSKMPDVDVAAQLITETVVWFAGKRLMGHDAHRFDDEGARSTVIAFICRALVEGDP